MKHLASSESAMRFRLAPIGAPVVQEATRTVSFIFSDNSVDRCGDTIDARGWQLANFRANPIALFGHDASTVENVIGRAKNVRIEGARLLGDIDFMSAEINPNAEAVYQMVKGGFLKTVSVGFQPIEWQRSTDKNRPGGVDFQKQELLEISIVPIPANANALGQAKAAGIDIAGLVFSTRAAPNATAFQSEQETSSMIHRSALENSPVVLPDIAERRRKAQAAAVAHGRPSSFPSMGRFLQAVAMQESSAQIDSRLVRAPTGAGEVNPTAGGFVVPTEYAETLISSIYEEAILAPLCDSLETDRPADFQIPVIDETSRVDGSRFGGAASYWLDEGTAPNASFPKFRANRLSAKKLIALSIASGELLQDAPMLESYVTRAFAAEASFKLDYSIIRGTGAGVPLGMVNAPGTITVPKTNGQAPGTIVAENISAMWSRLPAPCRRRAVWIVNEDAEAQLEAIGTASTAGMYFPAGTGGNQFALIKGRPVVVAEQCPQLGTPGDIILADLSQYAIITGGMKTALSLDLRFDSDQGVFRFVWRGNGIPTWSTPITPFNGGAIRSPYVILAQR